MGVSFGESAPPDRSSAEPRESAPFQIPPQKPNRRDTEKHQGKDVPGFVPRRVFGNVRNQISSRNVYKYSGGNCQKLGNQRLEGVAHYKHDNRPHQAREGGKNIGPHPARAAPAVCKHHGKIPDLLRDFVGGHRGCRQNAESRIGDKTRRYHATVNEIVNAVADQKQSRGGVVVFLRVLVVMRMKMQNQALQNKKQNDPEKRPDEKTIGVDQTALLRQFQRLGQQIEKGSGEERANREGNQVNRKPFYPRCSGQKGETPDQRE